MIIKGKIEKESDLWEEEQLAIKYLFVSLSSPQFVKPML